MKEYIDNQSTAFKSLFVLKNTVKLLLLYDYIYIYLIQFATVLLYLQVFVKTFYKLFSSQTLFFLSFNIVFAASYFSHKNQWIKKKRERERKEPVKKAPLSSLLQVRAFDKNVCPCQAFDSEREKIFFEVERKSKGKAKLYLHCVFILYKVK